MTVSTIGFLQRRRRSSPASFLIPKLPAVDLLTVLHSLSADISAVSPPPPPPTPIYRRHSAAIVRKCGIISAIFEEILRFNRKIKFSQSSILIFEEMFIVLQRIKALIDDISNGTSKIWLIIQIESVSSLFHDLTLDLRTLLELLPRNEFDLSEDVTELFTLVVNRCRDDKCFVDPVDEELRKAVLSLVESVRCGVVPDSVRLGEIFGRLGLSDSVSCREEIECLQDELTCQKDDKARSDVVGFVGLVRYAKTVLFGVLTPSLAESTRWNSSSELNAPTDFRCPISLELMSDPVVVSTGQTYERSSITLWIESDRKTCPKTGQTLAHTGLIPNKALKSLIATWCRENRVAYVAVDDNEGQTGVVVNKVALEAIKMTVSYLLGKLELSSVADLDSVEAVNRLVYELRVLAKTDSDSRACMGEAGAVPLLVRFLGSEHPNLQINAVTTLLNLSILEANKGRIMDIDGALNGVIEVLRSGATWEAKANAAATVFSLAGVSAYRKRLGKKSRVIKGLLELARAGPTSSKRDALVAILTLAGDREIAGRLIEGGAIDTIKEIMGELPEEAMTILETVVKKGGLVAVAAVNDMIGRLVATLRTGTDRTKESAIATLVIICRRGGAEMVAELAKVSTIEMVIWELMGNGTTRAKRKAASLMRMLRRWSAGVEGAGVLEEFATTVAIN